ncbi:MAG: hypothetical protein KGK07_07355 [Chloroflexota bacterium]|nr:hypothetical protein [Chloroflexota bacterium]
MTFAYADPPYLGMAHRYPEKQEVDHAELIARLVRDYPDGWALSCHSPSLRLLLPLCPESARVCAWVKPWCSWKPSMRMVYAWEPVIVCGGRQTKVRGKTPSVRDWVACSSERKARIFGQKPLEFSFWLFSALGMRPDDTLDDLYPGSGTVTRAWHAWRGSLLPLALAGDAR